jgi:DNA-binding CsgD family transcriptional regulator
MIGRSAALERLRGVVEMAELRSSDLPTVALIAGEAGIGKTRLLREMLAALPRDVTVFSALAEPRSLGRAFDVANQLAPAGSADPAADAAEAITTAASLGRVALVIEDLHWIDSDSVAVIDALARQPLPNLVVFATYRPSDLSRGAPGGDLVLRLERRNEVEQFRLDRLDRNEVGALMAAIAGRPVSSAAVEAVYRRSGGVPFVVEELMRIAGPDVCSDDLISAKLPWSLEEAVRQQLSDLTDADRTIVEVLAVFGQPAGFEALTTISGLDERDLIRHLRGLVERGVIVETRHDRLWFSHALVAESVTQQLLGRERRRLHEACLDALTAVAPDDFAALAHHADGAGRYDEIVAIARVGARAYLDRGASFQALRLACAGLSEDANEPSLLAVATEAAWRLDFLPEASAHARNWSRVAPTTADRIDAMRYVARLAVESDDQDAAEVMLVELIDLANGLPDGAERARAEAAVAQLLMLRGREGAIEWADRAIAQATAAGDHRVLVQARVERASAHSQVAERLAAIRELRDAAKAARDIGDGVLLSRALNNTFDLVAPQSREADLIRGELRRVAAEYGLDKLGNLNVMWWDAMCSYAAGDLASYRRLLNEWASWNPAPLQLSKYRTSLVLLAAEEGRVADGRALLNAGIVDPDLCASNFVNVQRLHLAGVAHDGIEGRRAFELMLGSESLSDNWFALGTVVQVVMSALDVGISPGEIRSRFLDGALQHHAARTALVEVADGLLAVAEGRTGEAAASLLRTVAIARDELPRPLEGAVRLALAQALLADGERADALIGARAAVESLSKWPGWRRDRAEALVARLEGTTVRPVGDLTARESEVAALIAEGLTNGQLAERLFISPKTAAVHVSNILAKLGLSSRTEIAAWSIRRDLPVAG